MALTTQSFKASYPARDTLALLNNVLSSFNTTPLTLVTTAPGLPGGFNPGLTFSGGGTSPFNPVSLPGGGPSSTSGGGSSA